LPYNIINDMQIISTPNPILTQPSQPVEKINRQVLDLIEEMKKTLLSAQKPKGVGLAAPQIGMPLRIFITKPFPKSKIEVFINPEIVWQSKEMSEITKKKNAKLEGCLSIPGIWGLVKRHTHLKLKFTTPDGKSHRQNFSSFMANIIQHEIDHLNGRLFSSRVLEQKGKFYQISKGKEDKEVLQELSLV